MGNAKAFGMNCDLSDVGRSTVDLDQCASSPPIRALAHSVTPAAHISSLVLGRVLRE